MKKERKALLIASLLVLCIAVGSLATYALMQSVTKTATNVFASDRNIGITLSEPDWEAHGSEDAKRYVPGQIIDKDPQVTLNDNSVSAYVALKVQYFEGVGDGEKQITYGEFKEKFLEDTKDGTRPMDFSENWTLISTEAMKDKTENGTTDISDVYMYNKILTLDDASTQIKENVTEPLFTKVHLSSGLTADNVTKLLPRFNIKVTAYAVQSEGVQELEIGDILYEFVTSR